MNTYGWLIGIVNVSPGLGLAFGLASAAGAAEGSVR